ncbi:MAG: 2,3-bisphosphoglycerate-independent phosphoglycerate mutase [Myxococcota bacterium]|nr:2,3-bisphosphoglycerate-independent phosphoglycerate mutase [Myxococcota bacterium]
MSSASNEASGPVVLVVLDGFGLGDGSDADATAAAHGPFFDDAAERYPNAQLETSGEAVGLPPGQMGNSEVGHMTMGAGRIIEQDMTRISGELAEGAMESNAVLRSALDAVAETGGTLHLIGLLSDGGVHSHQDHLYAILESCGRHGVPAAVHALLDGRDTPPKSGKGYLEQLLPVCEANGAHIATVIGRYYAMDRDNRWERVGLAYQAMVRGEGQFAPDAISAVTSAYAREETDEFVAPSVIENGRRICDGDAVLFFNFRADRAREITNALTGVLPKHYEGELDRGEAPELSRFVCLTEYDAEFGLPVAFEPTTTQNILGEVLAAHGLEQLRTAETEKYAHVTFFFNAGTEEPFPGEDRVLIPSPRDVDTYDHKPEMSALQLTDTLVGRIKEGDYDFILVNYANPDMVGHTGVMGAAVKAIETIDRCLDRLCNAVLERGGQLLITADHGNCELMIDPTSGEPHTAHTTNPVPIYWVTRDHEGRQLRSGGLADLAPTILSLMGIEAPAEMTGQSLIAAR